MRVDVPVACCRRYRQPVNEIVLNSAATLMPASEGLTKVLYWKPKNSGFHADAGLWSRAGGGVGTSAVPVSSLTGEVPVANSSRLLLPSLSGSDSGCAALPARCHRAVHDCHGLATTGMVYSPADNWLKD